MSRGQQRNVSWGKGCNVVSVLRYCIGVYSLYPSSVHHERVWQRGGGRRRACQGWHVIEAQHYQHPDIFKLCTRLLKYEAVLPTPFQLLVVIYETRFCVVHFASRELFCPRIHSAWELTWTLRPLTSGHLSSLNRCYF